VAIGRGWLVLHASGAYVKFPQRGVELFASRPGAGSGTFGPVSWVWGGSYMAGWRADLDALVQETMALTKSIRGEPPVPGTVVEPSRMLPVDPNRSERDKIQLSACPTSRRTRSASSGNAKSLQPPC
jgi:hypothetical protein